MSHECLHLITSSSSSHPASALQPDCTIILSRVESSLWHLEEPRGSIQSPVATVLQTLMGPQLPLKKQNWLSRWLKQDCPQLDLYLQALPGFSHALFLASLAFLFLSPSYSDGHLVMEVQHCLADDLIFKSKSGDVPITLHLADTLSRCSVGCSQSSIYFHPIFFTIR